MFYPHFTIRHASIWQMWFCVGQNWKSRTIEILFTFFHNSKMLQLFLLNRHQAAQFIRHWYYPMFWHQIFFAKQFINISQRWSFWHLANTNMTIIVLKTRRLLYLCVSMSWGMESRSSRKVSWLTSNSLGWAVLTEKWFCQCFSWLLPRYLHTFYPGTYILLGSHVLLGTYILLHTLNSTRFLYSTRYMHSTTAFPISKAMNDTINPFSLK